MKWQIQGISLSMHNKSNQLCPDTLYINSKLSTYNILTDRRYSKKSPLSVQTKYPGNESCKIINGNRRVIKEHHHAWAKTNYLGSHTRPLNSTFHLQL